MLEALESRRLFTVGAPDPSFGTDGIVTFPQLSEVRQIVRESDDSILAVTGQGLVHINADGVIDSLSSPLEPTVADIRFQRRGALVSRG